MKEPSLVGFEGDQLVLVASWHCELKACFTMGTPQSLKLRDAVVNSNRQ